MDKAVAGLSGAVTGSLGAPVDLSELKYEPLNPAKSEIRLLTVVSVTDAIRDKAA